MLNDALAFAGASISWLELFAFICALAGVALTALENPWGWPVSAIASLLYGWLFVEHRLYGDGLLQLYFIAVSLWGWRLWRTSNATHATPLRIHRLSVRDSAILAGALGAGWLMLGALLARFTDTDVPWFDAAPTVGSIAAQALVARKALQGWHLWIVVNAIAIALFSWKALWLTALLYALLLALAWVALRRWRRLCP